MLLHLVYTLVIASFLSQAADTKINVCKLGKLFRNPKCSYNNKKETKEKPKNKEPKLTQLVIVTKQYLTRKFFYSILHFTHSVFHIMQIYTSTSTHSLLPPIQNAPKAYISCILFSPVNASLQNIPTN
jgi:hypothetical protein